MARSHPTTANPVPKSNKKVAGSSRNVLKGLGAWLATTLVAFGAETKKQALVLIAGFLLGTAVWSSIIDVAGSSWRHLGGYEARKAARFAEAKAQKSDCLQAFGRQDWHRAHQHCGYAANTYKDYADLGDRDGLFELGALVCLGWGVEKNTTFAQQLFERAKLDHVQRHKLSLGAEFTKDCMPRTTG